MYSEILIGPIKAGKEARDHVDAMLGHFSIEIIAVDGAFARRAAAVRARTGLRLPDAYALATAIDAEHNGHDDVRRATFDKAVLRAHAELHPKLGRWVLLSLRARERCAGRAACARAAPGRRP